MIIFNLTQHEATFEQVAQGVCDLPDDLHKQVIELITFDEPPKASEMLRRAQRICAIVDSLMSIGVYGAMIGGAPFFMATLERTLFEECGIVAKYSFSQRVSQETVGPNNEVVKVSTFKHVSFVDAVV